jgi:hypothetical protein
MSGMEPRLPARLEAMALIRAVQAAGGFAAVLHRGEPDSGSLLLVLTENGTNSKVYERMPLATGAREWLCAKQQDVEKPHEFSEYLDRRSHQDPDLWVVELDIPDAERFIP